MITAISMYKIQFQFIWYVFSGSFMQFFSLFPRQDKLQDQYTKSKAEIIQLKEQLEKAKYVIVLVVVVVLVLNTEITMELIILNKRFTPVQMID